MEQEESMIREDDPPMSRDGGRLRCRSTDTRSIHAIDAIQNDFHRHDEVEE
jgi:hypothetical protein